MPGSPPQPRVLFLFPGSSDIRYLPEPPKVGHRVRSENGNVWAVTEVLKSGIDTYTVTCVAPPKGVRDVAVDLLDLARNSISPSRPAVPDSRTESPLPMDRRMTQDPDWVTLPPDVPIASDALVGSQDTGSYSDDESDTVEHEKQLPIADALASQQLSALARVSELFGEERIAYWLFGGWAVDFYAGSVTRVHDDVDIAVWLKDVPRIMELLEEDGWRHAPAADEDGGTGYERGPVRLELTYLVRDPDGGIFTPLRRGRAGWSIEALADEVGELHGVRSRLVALTPLMRAKSSPRDDPAEAAKDSADFEHLSRVGTGSPIETQ